jgi:hypothetical protein
MCGQPFRVYEGPKPDAIGDAVLPRRLRPAGSAAPLFAILLVFLALLVIFYLLMRA